MKIIRQTDKNQLNILCVGQYQAGKSTFLSLLTKQASQTAPELPSSPFRHSVYNIYCRKVNKKLTYFHELSQKQPLYLEQFYDGVLYFVDLAGTMRTGKQLLRWMELYAQCSTDKRPVQTIPIYVVVTKAYGYKKVQKWKQKLLKQLQKIVNVEQILFLDSMAKANKCISTFCRDIEEKKAEGIKLGYKNYWKMYGIEEMLRYLLMNLEYYFVFEGKEENTGFYVDDDNGDEDQNQNKNLDEVEKKAEGQITEKNQQLKEITQEVEAKIPHNQGKIPFVENKHYLTNENQTQTQKL